jgi:hypothetical protein
MRQIPIFLFANISFIVNGQLWERAYQRSEEIRLEQALAVGGGRWAVMGMTEPGDHFISVHNADGTIAWEKVGYFITGQGFGEVVLLPDSGLLHVGAFDGCDYIGWESRVRRFAADGTMLWEREIIPWNDPPTMAAKGTMDHIAVASRDSVYIMDPDGNIVGGFPLQGTGTLWMITWGADNSLVMHRGSNLRRVNMSGTFMATTTIGTYVTDMLWYGDELWVLANDSIHRYSQDLVHLGAAALLGMSWASRFVVSESDLFVHTTTGLFQLGTDGTPTLLFSWPALPNHTTFGCAVRDTTVLTVGRTSIAGRYSGIVRTLSLNGDAPQHDQDVEVLIQVDSTWTEFQPGNWWRRYGDITGRVVNHGSTHLSSIVLSMLVTNTYHLCGMEWNRIDTAGFSLAPGDTLVLPFGQVLVARWMNMHGVAGEAQICITALAPDQHADRFPEDNFACETVEFVLGVEEVSFERTLSVAPNPAHNTCLLSGLTALDGPVRLRIMDPTGRVVAEHAIAAASDTIQLDILGLPPATYILVAEGRRGRAVQRLVVAR